MSKINTFAYLRHFYRGAAPFKDDILLQIKSRNIEDIPLDGIYEFRLFDSDLSFEQIAEIINGIRHSLEVEEISGLLEKFIELEYEVYEKIVKNGNSEVARSLADSIDLGKMNDLCFNLRNPDNLSNYNEISNLTRWFLIGDPISDKERKNHLEFYQALENPEMCEKVSKENIIMSGIDGHHENFFVDEIKVNLEGIYPSAIRAKSLVKVCDVNPKKWY